MFVKKYCLILDLCNKSAWNIKDYIKDVELRYILTVAEEIELEKRKGIAPKLSTVSMRGYN